MIGIVAVSHSARLGEAALELALQMVHDGEVRVRVAAGAGVDAEGVPILGTDAVAVSAAIDELATECDGVLVLMDLGSAVLSAELAVELRSSDVPVRLAPAPFVEGFSPLSCPLRRADRSTPWRLRPLRPWRRRPAPSVSRRRTRRRPPMLRRTMTRRCDECGSATRRGSMRVLRH